MQNPYFTSGKVFEETLKRLGVFSGIRMVVHSSFPSLGIFEGGVENPCNILCKLVSEEGTLMMPGLVCHPKEGEEFVYGHDITPVSTGFISETFRHQPGVVRSLDPPHSFRVWGKDKIPFIRELNNA